MAEKLHYMSTQASVCPPVLIGSPPSQLTPLAPVCSQLTPLTPACSQLSPASQLTPSTGRPKWISRFTFWCPHYMSAQASVHPPLLIGSPLSQLTPLAPACSQLSPACSSLPAHSPHSSLLQALSSLPAHSSLLPALSSLPAHSSLLPALSSLPACSQCR